MMRKAKGALLLVAGTWMIVGLSAGVASANASQPVTDDELMQVKGSTLLNSIKCQGTSCCTSTGCTWDAQQAKCTQTYCATVFICQGVDLTQKCNPTLVMEMCQSIVTAGKDQNGNCVCPPPTLWTYAQACG